MINPEAARIPPIGEDRSETLYNFADLADLFGILEDEFPPEENIEPSNTPVPTETTGPTPTFAPLEVDSTISIESHPTVDRSCEPDDNFEGTLEISVGGQTDIWTLTRLPESDGLCTLVIDLGPRSTLDVDGICTTTMAKLQDYRLNYTHCAVAFGAGDEKSLRLTYAPYNPENPLPPTYSEREGGPPTPIYLGTLDEVFDLLLANTKFHELDRNIGEDTSQESHLLDRTETIVIFDEEGYPHETTMTLRAFSIESSADMGRLNISVTGGILDPSSLSKLVQDLYRSYFGFENLSDETIGMGTAILNRRVEGNATSIDVDYVATESGYDVHIRTPFAPEEVIYSVNEFIEMLPKYYEFDSELKSNLPIIEDSSGRAQINTSLRSTVNIVALFSLTTAALSYGIYALRKKRGSIGKDRLTYKYQVDNRGSQFMRRRSEKSYSREAFTFEGHDFIFPPYKEVQPVEHDNTSLTKRVVQSTKNILTKANRILSTASTSSRKTRPGEKATSFNLNIQNIYEFFSHNLTDIRSMLRESKESSSDYFFATLDRKLRKHSVGDHLTFHLGGREIHTNLEELFRHRSILRILRTLKEDGWDASEWSEAERSQNEGGILSNLQQTRLSYETVLAKPGETIALRQSPASRIPYTEYVTQDNELGLPEINMEQLEYSTSPSRILNRFSRRAKKLVVLTASTVRKTISKSIVKLQSRSTRFSTRHVMYTNSSTLLQSLPRRSDQSAKQVFSE